MAVRIGSHVSSVGGPEATAARAHELGCQALQIFTSSPRQWRAPRPAGAEAGKSWQRSRRQYGLRPLVVHANYLINLASADKALQQRSRGALRGELERAAAIGAEYLVLHPGSGERARAAKGIRAAADGFGWGKLRLLLENTAGGGAQLGGTFSALGDLLHDLEGMPVGACIDTCHAWVAGYDWLTDAGYASTVRELEQTIGLRRAPVWHANDAQAERGSHHDRHAHIGAGKLGTEFFHRLLRDRRLQGRAFIVETPPEGQAADLAALRER